MSLNPTKVEHDLKRIYCDHVGLAYVEPDELSHIIDKDLLLNDIMSKFELVKYSNSKSALQSEDGRQLFTVISKKPKVGPPVITFYVGREDSPRPNVVAELKEGHLSRFRGGRPGQLQERVGLQDFVSADSRLKSRRTFTTGPGVVLKWKAVGPGFNLEWQLVFANSSFRQTSPLLTIRKSQRQDKKAFKAKSSSSQDQVRGGCCGGACFAGSPHLNWSYEFSAEALAKSPFQLMVAEKPTRSLQNAIIALAVIGALEGDRSAATAAGASSAMATSVDTQAITTVCV